MRWLIGLVGVAAAACASVPAGDPFEADLLRADALVWQGCYDCLIEAQAIYDSLPAAPVASLRRFETAMLIVLREKELAVDPTDSLTRLRAAAGDVPATLGADRYVDLVDLVPADETGTPLRARPSLTPAARDLRANLASVVTELQAAGGLRPIVRDYLDLVLACAFDLPEPPPATADAPPLLTYRRAICDLALPDLDRLLDAYPRFVEAGYFIGRARVLQFSVTGIAGVRELLTNAAADLPLSVSIAFLQGMVGQLTTDCDSAVDHYARAIALQPLHDRAWVGMVACLSQLGRHTEAITAATTVIEEELALAEGYYWRAWNHHAEGRLAAARADIDLARTRGTSTDILTLAGIIEHDQDDLELAEVDLTAATRGRNGTDNCPGWWYFGSVSYKQERYRRAAEQFEQAMGCFDRRVTRDTRERDRIRTLPGLEADHRERLLASLDQAIASNAEQQFAAAFSAAVYFAAVGDRARAAVLLDLATGDPALADRIGELRQKLTTGP